MISLSDQIVRIAQQHKTTHDSYRENDSEIYFAEDIEPIIKLLAERLEASQRALKFYARPVRDKSFKEWMVDWREVEIVNESDYEYFPNHTVAVDAFADNEAAVKGLGNV